MSKNHSVFEHLERRWMVSSDSHVIEPPGLWHDRVPAELRNLAPRVAEEDDADWWYVEGAKTMSFLGIQTGFRFDRPPEQLRTRARLADVRPAVFDPQEYVKENEVDGVWASVLYPSQGMIVFRAPTTAVVEASCRAYNDWLAEFCAGAPGRLGGIAMLSADDPEWAAAELGRARTLGLVGALLPVSLIGSSYRDPRYDVLWAAAQDCDMPLSFHVATDRVRPNAPPEPLDVAAATEAVFINKDYAMRQTLADLILSGVFERFPRLQVGAVEFETGWIPYFLEQMDYTYSQRPVRASWHRFAAGVLPSDFFRSNVFASFQEDSVGIRELPVIGVENLLWGSDYPHTESTFPRSRQLLASIFGSLAEEEIDRLVVSNTVERYGLRPPPEVRAP